MSDPRPALGTPGEPASWQGAGGGVPLHRPAFADAEKSYLFGPDTSYAATEPEPGEVAAAARRMRGGERPAAVQGPVVKPPVWTWEVPAYFWLGGVAAGASFAALGCDLAGDHRSAARARRVALGAAVPCPALLAADLGRPGRFLNMLRVFKPRSPMSTGAWCLTAFGATASGAVAADLAGRDRLGRGLGAGSALIGAYLGSYAGVLLATTAVPVWARSRSFLGPIFVATSTASGASATRLALALPSRHPTRVALGSIETGAVAAELSLALVNRRRLGEVAPPLHSGRSGRIFRAAEGAAAGGLALRLARNRLGPRAEATASALFLASSLALRFAWMEVGRASARDDEAVARTARETRGQATRFTETRGQATRFTALARRWSGAVGRVSLAIEGAVRREGSGDAPNGG